MTVEEAMKLRDFYYLIPFHGFYRGWRLTGKFFYEEVLKKNEYSNLKVEIRTSRWFPWRTKWVYLSDIKPIYRANV
jgi:hypothetical protein